MAAPVRLALPSAATDPISRTVPYQHQRCQPQYQAAEQHKPSLSRMTATTVAPVSVRAKRRAATGNDHVHTENDPDLAECQFFLDPDLDPDLALCQLVLDPDLRCEEFLSGE